MAVSQFCSPGLRKRAKQAKFDPQGWKNFLFATRHNGTTPKKSVAKLEPGLKTWSPKQNTKAKNCKTVQKKTRELQVHFIKDARHLNLCTSKVFAVKLENMYIIKDK